MPLVRISLLKGKPASYRRKVGDAVHQAMVETINVPPDDRFQIVTEHDPEDFVFDREFLGIRRSRDLVMVQITLSTGRSLAQKRALYRAIASRLGGAAQLRSEDVLISLVENTREDWSFGNGVASYAPQETVAA
ncbi:MAG TPA: tautomerase family protein [Burkholderiales bacterium]|nr:tautomerase family protein [Burkholderiales bacterium]